MRVMKVAAGAAVLIGAGLGGTVAVAASSPSAGAVRVFVTPSSRPASKILVTGAIGDYGTALTVNQNGKTNRNGNFQKVTLQKGGFVVDATALNKKLNASRPTINNATCSVVFSGSAPTTMSNGTGLYRGISGTVKITVTFAGVAPRYASGSHAGQCNLHATPQGQYESIAGTGNVRFG